MYRLKLYALIMVVVIPRFTKATKACKKKINLLFKQWKTHKLANARSREEKLVCKFNKSIDQCWHQVGTIMKHVITLPTTHNCFNMK